MLTEQKIARLKPGAVPREIADGKVPGCYFTLHPSGAASWTLRYKCQIRSRKFTLGKYPAVSLKAARVDGTRDAAPAGKGNHWHGQKARPSQWRPQRSCSKNLMSRGWAVAGASASPQSL